MERPKITTELVAEVARAFCSRNGLDADQAAQLALAFRSTTQDGYELAKALESRFFWLIDAELVQTLDYFGSDVREAHRQACLNWASVNNIQPPLPIGTMIEQGRITGVYMHDGACYEVLKHGDPEDSCSRRIIRFEDARAKAANAGCAA